MEMTIGTEPIRGMDSETISARSALALIGSTKGPGTLDADAAMTQLWAVATAHKVKENIHGTL